MKSTIPQQEYLLNERLLILFKIAFWDNIKYYGRIPL